MVWILPLYIANFFTIISAFVGPPPLRDLKLHRTFVDLLLLALLIQLV
jgi:hypothetical protein